MVNFIGIGAQKAGTSWVYACLFEHPDVCIPIKEIHFFSRERFKKGQDWYETHFKRCHCKKVKGEFSTSYLYSEDAAERIASMYPESKIIAILREPSARAYSQYRNAIKAGEIPTSVSFTDYVHTEPSCIQQGLYAQQLKRYCDTFPKEQILVLLYEDIARDPKSFMQTIYKHIGVDNTFVPPSLDTRINVARTPKNVYIDSIMHNTAEFLRRYGAGKLVHALKRSGVTDAIRAVNTSKTKETLNLSPYRQYFAADIRVLKEVSGIDVVTKWNYE